jgi:hypothetical protein
MWRYEARVRSAGTVAIGKQVIAIKAKSADLPQEET